MNRILREVEKMPPEELAELQLERLRRQLAYLSSRSPFYREKLRSAGMEPDDLRGLDDLGAIPPTTKDELRAHNREVACAPDEDIVDIGATTGTTGEAVILPTTQNDWDELVELLMRGMHGLGVQKSDVFQVAVAFDQLFSLGAPLDDALKNLGVTVVRTGPGNRRRQVELMRRLGTTCIMATPDFMLLLAEEARELGHEPREDFCLRMGVFIGHGLYTADWRPNALNRRVAEAWDIEVYSDYGSMEMLAGLIECAEHGGHHVPADQLLVEVIDPDTGKPLPPGEPGELVATHLGRTGTPLLRFRQGDITTIQTEPCRCGRTTPRVMAVLDRLDHMLKIKGVSVYPRQVEQALMQIPEVKGYLVEAYTEDSGGDGLRIRVSVGSNEEAVLDKVRKAVKARARILPDHLETAPQEEITRLWYSEDTRKPRKFRDLRKR